MHPLQACAVALGVGAAVLGAHGLSIPVQRRAMPHSTSVHMTTSTPDDDEFGFQNIGNILYTGILDVGGHKFTVIIHFPHRLCTPPSNSYTKIRFRSTLGLLTSGLTLKM